MRQAYILKNLNDEQQGQGLSIDLNILTMADIENKDATEIAFLIIDMRNWQKGWETLCTLRQHLTADIYLKPVVFLMDSIDVPNEIKQAADGHIAFSALNQPLIDEWASKLEPINLWIDRLTDRESTSDSNLSFKILRIIASRNMELKPITTIRRTSGYVYPILEPLFGVRDTGVLETLNFLQSQSLLTEKFVTKAHFCGHCSSAFLNFKEVCPHCSSDDLTIDELVHHFKCAYTAELSEFHQGDRLVCPKCELPLRHIGVDYDKPSTVSRCNQCNHRFQDAQVMTDCYSCGRSAEPSNQVIQNINAYTVSAIGQNAAYYGLDALFTNLLESELHLYSATAFKEFFRVEVARIERYKVSTSSLGMINFKELDSLYLRLGKKAQQVFAELSAIFKIVFRESDVITAHNESIFFVLMTETNSESAITAMERLNVSVKALFENNLDVTLDIKTLIKAVDTEIDLGATLESFLIDSQRAD